METRADELLAELKAAGSEIQAADLERILERAIRECGVTTLARGASNADYIDFAVWSDDLQPWVSIPLAVELRLNLSTTRDLHSAVENLTRVLVGASVPWGLLIYHASKINVGQELKAPNILAVSAEQFLTSLRKTSFGDLIRRLRKERVHGSS